MHILRGDQLKTGVAAKIKSGEKKFLTIEDFQEQFVKEMSHFRASLSSKLQFSHQVAGKPMTGRSTGYFVPAIVEAINEKAGDLHIPDIWGDADNQAINDASIRFRQDFQAVCDKIQSSKEVISTALGKQVCAAEESLIALANK